MESKSGVLYPMMILAAISVIIFSIVGIAAITGHMPSALSQKILAGPDAPKAGVAETGKESPGNRRAAPAQKSETWYRGDTARRPFFAGTCGNCGVIEAIRAVEQKGEGSGVGAVAGGVTGAVLGNQVGKGSGRTAATILGAAGGAYVGNEIEKSTKKTTLYRITVRMEDGTYRTVTQQNQPGFSVGEKVKVVDGAIVSRG